MNWYAVYTKPKQESRVEENLSQASIEVFNPKFRKKKLIRGKYEYVTQVFFPRYIFVRFDPVADYRTIKYTRGVSNIVGNKGVPWPVSEEIINIVRSRMDEEGFVVVAQDIKAGDRVEITEGPLKGFIGIFERETKDRDRILVLLNTIGYHATVEVERDFLKKQAK